MSEDASRQEAPPELRAAQRLMRALVTAPTGIESALDGRAGVPGWLDEWPDPKGALTGTVSGDDRLDATARLDVYAQGYFARLHEILEDDYPTVAWLCGEAAFNDLVTAYLVAHPSKSPSLRDLGRAFAGFLDSHPVTAFARERWPLLVDVARLEWAFAEVFDAADARPLERAELASLPPESWAEISLSPVPAFELLAVDPAAGQAVLARRRGAPPPAAIGPPGQPTGSRGADAEGPATQGAATEGAETRGPAVAASSTERGTGAIVAWRDGERAVFRPIEPLEAEGLGRVVRGDTFGDLCAWLAGRTSEETAAATAAGWLAAWVDAGWLLRLPELRGLR